MQGVLRLAFSLFVLSIKELDRLLDRQLTSVAIYHFRPLKLGVCVWCSDSMSTHVDCTILSLSGTLCPLLISLNPSLYFAWSRIPWLYISLLAAENPAPVEWCVDCRISISRHAAVNTACIIAWYLQLLSSTPSENHSQWPWIRR